MQTCAEHYFERGLIFFSFFQVSLLNHRDHCAIHWPSIRAESAPKGRRGGAKPKHSSIKLLVKAAFTLQSTIGHMQFVTLRNI